MLVVHGLENAGRMAYEVWWALAFGFAISAIVQAWVTLEEDAREHARTADAGHEHHAMESTLPLRRRLVSAEAWSDVAHNFRGDWQMLWKEIGIGFVLAGFAGLIPNRVFEAAFLTNAPAPFQLIENVIL